MEDGHRPEVTLAEPGRQLLADHDRAMESAGAADRDREARLSLLDIGGHEQVQHLLERGEELAGDRLAEHVLADLRREPAVGAQRLDVVGVLHEPHIEHEVGLERDAVLEAEADELDREAIGPLHVAEAREDALAQLAQGEVARVEDDVRLLADPGQHLALLRDRCGDPALVRQRVAMPGLAEAADEDVVARLEEDDHRSDAASLERAAHRPEREGHVAGPDIEHDRRPREASRVGRDQVREVAQQLAGQVVHDDVSEILEQLRRRRLAAARHPRDDDDLHLRVVGQAPGLAGAPARHIVDRVRCRQADVVGHGWLRYLPLRRMATMVPSYRMYIVTPSTNGLTRSPPGVAAAAKIAIPRIAIRRESLSRFDVTMPTRDRPYRRIGNSMIRPNTRNSIVTKSKYGPAVISGFRYWLENWSRNWTANGMIT